MSCQSSPTLTQFGTFTSTSISTTFSSSLTTLPDSTSTSIITSCLDAATVSGSGSAVGSCTSSTLITSTSVITGGVSTAQVPVAVTVEITTTTPTATLFASCTTDGGSTQDTTTSPTTTTTDTTSSTTSTEITTPTLTFTTSVNTTLPNGQVTQTPLTVTTTLPPSTSVVTMSVPKATMQGDGTSGKSSGVSVGPIVGGAVGGFVGLIALVGLIWFFCRRRANWDDIFEKDYEEYTGSAVRPTRSRMLDMEDDPVPSGSLVNTEPKPYQYGLVGAGARTPPSLNAGLPTTPSSGGFPQTGAKNAGQLGGHNRTLSETPLVLNVQPGVGGQGQLMTPNSTGSRPSTGGSYNAYPGAGPSSTGHGHGNVMLSNASPPPRAPTPGAGALGVSINTGPSLSMDDMAAGRSSIEHYNLNGPESPTSIVSPPRKLFIANQVDVPSSPPPVSSSRPGSPGSPAPSNHGAGPSSFSGAFAGAAGQRNNYPSAAEEKSRLQHNPSIGGASVSTASAYSQPSGPPSSYHGYSGSGGQPPLPPGAQRAVSPQSFSTARAQSPQAAQSELAYLSDPEEVPAPTRRTERRTSQGVIVHHDAGHLDPDSMPPPAYAG